MERIKNLGSYQKAILLIMILMVLVFTVLYPMTVSREGFAYKNAILTPKQENGNTVYSGKLRGKQAVFTVSSDKTVTFQYGDKVYGPYVVKEDASAVPKDSNMKDVLTGIELYCGKKVIFRGGVGKGGASWLLVDEDGWSAVDTKGDPLDPMEPSFSSILDLMGDPALEHKGNWYGWIAGVIVCIVTALTVLFADEMFRLSLVFKIDNVDQVEPSDWELASRYIAWTVFPVVALALFIMGLL